MGKLVAEIQDASTPKREFRAESKEGDDKREIISVAHDVRTLEDVLNKGEIDLSIWEIERCVINSWECVGDKIGRQPLWQVKVWLRRKVPKPYTDAFEAICQRMKAHAPKYVSLGNSEPAKQRKDEPHLLELGLFDLHFGKLAWEPESGNNYDLKIAEKVFREAVEDLVSSAKGYRIERFLLPVGNDLVHIDTLENTTTAGTRQDVDGRYAKIIETVEMSLINAIDLLMQKAPVDVLWVPGNHDRLASYHVCRTLGAWYRNARQVKVDYGASLRKYYQYGQSLIGFTHGNEEKHATLPNIMATEQPQLWAATKHHEWHIGHGHRKRATSWLSVDEHQGTVLRMLPSLSGTDSWHYSKGYVCTGAPPRRICGASGAAIAVIFT